MLINDLDIENKCDSSRKQKAIQHFGSDGGAEMAAAYHSIVSTVLMKMVSVWKFLGAFFEDIVSGETRHLGMLKLSAAQ